jgi:Fur family peroxide stress response transcriptional regulator
MDGKRQVKPKAPAKRFSERLANGGFRFTQQRERVYEVLLERRDHPTAEDVFIRARKKRPEISVATVYNCLDALVHCGLVREVNVQRGATRFCPNMSEHCHFYCDACKQVFDIEPPVEHGIRFPRGFEPKRFDISVHGHCPGCAAKNRRSAK